MFFVEDNVIYITRGDDAELEVSITDGEGTAYTMQDGDVLTLTVRELPDFDSEAVCKIDSETNRIIFSHADTADAEAGRYSADIQLTSEGKRRTVWPELEDSERYKVKNFRNFVIMPEVTE